MKLMGSKLLFFYVFQESSAQDFIKNFIVEGMLFNISVAVKVNSVCLKDNISADKLCK